jgi:hypothetical protein
MATLPEICTQIGKENENEKISISKDSRVSVAKAFLVKILGMIPEPGISPKTLASKLAEESPFYDESITILLLGCTFSRLGLVEETPPGSSTYVLTEYARQASYEFVHQRAVNSSGKLGE